MNKDNTINIEVKSCQYQKFFELMGGVSFCVSPNGCEYRV